MKIYASKTYLNEFNKLAKKKKGPYCTIEKDVKDWFKEHNTFEKIWKSNYPLRESGPIRINKVRISNSQFKKGSSSGFRLITFCNESTKTVGLLYIFPKTGPSGMDNINDEFEKKLIKSYLEECKANTIFCLKELEEIAKEAAQTKT